MKLADALLHIRPPYGATTIVAAVMSGDFDPIKRGPSATASREEAERQRDAAQERRDKATSDWSYWGYWAERHAWASLANLLAAAAISGADDLPDVPGPPFEGVVMDVGAKMERWSADVLAAAQRRRKGNKDE